MAHAHHGQIHLPTIPTIFDPGELARRVVETARKNVLDPYLRWRRIKPLLEEVESLSERDLLDIGCTRAQLREAVRKGA